MERNKILDTIKYILIILVVIGHFIEPTKYTNQITTILYCLIYSFHMPLFVLISGYFFKQRETKIEIKKCIPLLEICFLSHMGFYLLRNSGCISLSDFVNFGGDPAWYLLSLVYWRIGTIWLLKRFDIKQIFVMSLALDLISFLTIKYGGFMSIGRTIAFYPFFILGYYLKDHLMEITYQCKKSFVILGVLSLMFIIVTSGVLQFQIEFQRASLLDLRQYTETPTYLIFIYRYIILVSSLFISALLLIIVEYFTFIQKLALFGQSTLFIYYVQTFMFAIIGIVNISLTQSLIIAFLTVPILTHFANYSVSKYIMNPISSTIALCK